MGYEIGNLGVSSVTVEIESMDRTQDVNKLPIHILAVLKVSRDSVYQDSLMN